MIRKYKEIAFFWLCSLFTYFSIFVIFVLLFHILKEGLSWIDFDFLNNFSSRFPHKAGIKAAIYGSLWLMVLTFIISIPIGVLTAIYIEEYMIDGKFKKLVQINISNLAGLPSIVYGMLGLAVFVRFLQLERSLISGAFTLSLLILPIIIISSQGAIKAVSDSIRFGAYALGAKRWQVVFGQVLPAAFPGIATGTILAMSRAIGETAPLVAIGAANYVAFLPSSIFDSFTILPIQIFNWASRPQEAFHNLAAASIIILLIMLFFMNLLAVIIRYKFDKNSRI